MRRTLFCAAISAALLAYVPVFAAEDAATNAAEPSEAAPAAPDASAKRVLTPEELAEKEARKECKKKICDIIATRDPNGEDVACDITKTWREEDIVKMLGGKISWPWGKAVCQSRLELKRKPLALAMSESEYEIVMPAQKVRCTLAQKETGRALCHRDHPGAEGEIQGRQGVRGDAQLGRGVGADVHLSADLCRHRLRQLGQCPGARGGAPGERVHHQEMHRGEG